MSESNVPRPGDDERADAEQPASTKTRWKDWEDLFLRAKYLSMPPREIARITGRNPDEIVARAQKLGIVPGPRKVRWAAQEDALLQECISEGMSFVEAAARVTEAYGVFRTMRAARRRWTAITKAPAPRRETPSKLKGAHPKEGTVITISGPSVPDKEWERMIGALFSLRGTVSRLESAVDELKSSGDTIKHGEMIALALIKEGKRRERAVRAIIPNYGINEDQFFEDVDTFLANEGGHREARA